MTKPAREKLADKTRDIDLDKNFDQYLEWLPLYLTQVDQAEEVLQKPSEPLDPELLEMATSIKNPEGLIAYFEELYAVPIVRFQNEYWLAAIEHLKDNLAEEERKKFCAPIIAFVVTHDRIRDTIRNKLSEVFSLSQFAYSAEAECLGQETGINYRQNIAGTRAVDIYLKAFDYSSYPEEKVDDLLTVLLAPGDYDGKDISTREKIMVESAKCERDSYLQIPEGYRTIYAWQRLAHYYLHLEGAHPCSELVDQALTFFPENEYLLFLKYSFELDRRQDMSALRDDLISKLQVHPHYLKLLLVLGKSALKSRDFSTAQRIFDKLSQIDPMHMDYRLGSILAKTTASLEVKSKDPSLMLYSERQYWLLALSSYYAREHGCREDILFPYGMKDEATIEKAQAKLRYSFNFDGAYYLEVVYEDITNRRSTDHAMQQGLYLSYEEQYDKMQELRGEHYYDEAKRVADCMPWLKNLIPSHNLPYLAWLIRMAANADYLSEEEAWQKLEEIGALVEERENSWDSFLRTHLTKLQQTKLPTPDEMQPVVDNMLLLLSNESSLIRRVSWPK
ncbi:hypothetical protein BFP72_02440 [Reichenbachiella sp. 5M10]|uniref:DUF1266 domain-containing protein n=1 Tax=Reichenbachiella sp. 5M10 TaxID=1889772 RepID=UPI000C149FDB|nr:DUF1266 domain-containing protein [Reichenbachiella sp. 5M10]PIB34359.1 hypothetical protein BFP72_02440 [Reichenbachiella sp. 5M10]